jgi:hypothetical protein
MRDLPMKCLETKCRRKPTLHHFPVKKAHGGRITVPLCRCTHNKAEIMDVDTIEMIIEKAPEYWMRTGQWRRAKGSYYKFVNEWRINHPKRRTDVLDRADSAAGA